MTAEPASKTSCMLQAIRSVHRNINVTSKPLSLTNTSSTLILSYRLCLVLKVTSYFHISRIKLFMLFLSAPCVLLRPTSLLLILISQIMPTSVEHPRKITLLIAEARVIRTYFNISGPYFYRTPERTLSIEALFSYLSVLCFL
jgi:hypothetical protein